VLEKAVTPIDAGNHEGFRVFPSFQTARADDFACLRASRRYVSPGGPMILQVMRNRRLLTVAVRLSHVFSGKGSEEKPPDTALDVNDLRRSLPMASARLSILIGAGVSLLALLSACGFLLFLGTSLPPGQLMSMVILGGCRRSLPWSYAAVLSSWPLFSRLLAGLETVG